MKLHVEYSSEEIQEDCEVYSVGLAFIARAHSLVRKYHEHLRFNMSPARLSINQMERGSIPIALRQ